MTRQMKDSGVEWVGEIPENWKTGKLRFLARLKTGNTPPKENGNLYYEDGLFLWIKPEDLNEFSPVLETREKLNELGLELSRNVPPYTPLVCCIGSIGKYGISNQMSCFNQQINAVLFDEDLINKKYGLYYISSQEEQHLFYANGNVVKILNTTGQGNIIFSIPPLSEQKAIASFLDEKCNAIDEIIAKTEQSIEEYKKLKQSVITEAVTKGIRPNRKMKDSGIAWIGEIPVDWEYIRIKNASWLKGRIGWQGLTSNEYQSDGPYLITGTDFNNGNINWEKCVHISEERFQEAPEIHIKENDLLMTKDGTVGKVAIVKNCPEKVSLNSGVLLIRNIRSKKYNERFLYYILLSNIFWNWFNSNQTGNSTIIHLYQEQFYNFSFPLPPLSEQKAIASFLDQKCAEIEDLIEKKQQFLTELATYKKSLIYEYVTGKKEVV